MTQEFPEILMVELVLHFFFFFLKKGALHARCDSLVLKSQPPQLDTFTLEASQSLLRRAPFILDDETQLSEHSQHVRSVPFYTLLCAMSI